MNSFVGNSLSKVLRNVCHISGIFKQAPYFQVLIEPLRAMSGTQMDLLLKIKDKIRPNKKNACV